MKYDHINILSPQCADFVHFVQRMHNNKHIKLKSCKDITATSHQYTLYCNSDFSLMNELTSHIPTSSDQCCFLFSLSYCHIFSH